MPWPGLGSFFTPRLDWIQVEVTTHCNAACVYCPHTVYRDHWASRHLPLATFRQMLPSFAKARLVYLQGWGEPFLNPDFFHMVALAKQAGCRVGVTTNGMLLDAGTLEKIVEAGIDLVAFSMAGTDEKNDAVRRGTSLKKVLEMMEGLNLAKERRGRSRPALHVAYMLLRSGLPDLVRLPQLLGGLGVSQVVVSTLDFVASRELADEALTPEKAQEYEELKVRLVELTEASRAHHLDIHYQPKEPGRRRRVCPENVQQAFFIGSDGTVSPCVYGNLPVAGVSYFAGNRGLPYQRLTFGNLNELSLPAIWRQRAYAAFRHSFSEGKLALPCQSCSKL